MSDNFNLKDLLIDTRLTGPNGGNLNNPKQYPDKRNTSLNVTRDTNGLLSLHKFEDTATMGRKNEQPWHRMAAYMLLSGRTNGEIARAASVTEPTVSQLRAQKWFQELLATLANEHGQDIMGVLRAESLASVEKLVNLRDNADSERVQLAAAQTLLEHAHGKAVQKVIAVTAKTTFKSAQEEMEALRSELADLEGMKRANTNSNT